MACEVAEAGLVDGQVDADRDLRVLRGHVLEDPTRELPERQLANADPLAERGVVTLQQQVVAGEGVRGGAGLGGEEGALAGAQRHLRLAPEDPGPAGGGLAARRAVPLRR